MGTLELVQTLTKHIGRVWNVDWHPKGQILASCGEDKSIRIWGQELGVTFKSKWANKKILTGGHERTIREVSWSPCGDYLASASFDASIGIWSKKSGEYVNNCTMEGHENEVKSVAWSPSGLYFASCSRDKSVWIWERVKNPQAEEDRDADAEEYECLAVLNAHTQDVKKVVWHPKTDILASASYDNTIKLIKQEITDDNDRDNWICFATLKGHESTVWSISWDPTGTRLASCSDDKTVKIWREYLSENNEGIPVEDQESVWKCVATLSGYHTRTIYDICWSPITGLIATACGDDCLRIFRGDENSADPNSNTFSQVASVEKAHSQDVNCVTWNPVIPELLASCSDDGEIKLWNFSEQL